MLPSTIVECARQSGLHVVAICDHNSAGNVAAVRRSAGRGGLYVIGGMEITSSEEVHVLGLFETDESLTRMQARVQDHLPGMNDPRFFGEQLLADADGTFVGQEEHLLAGASTLTVEQVVSVIHELGGLAIASHIDRDTFSIVGQLGFIPPGLELDALGLSTRVAPHQWRAYRKHGLPLVKSSDAHFPEDIGRAWTTFIVETVSFDEIRMALEGRNGRRTEL